MDVNNSLFNGDLTKNVFMVQPFGYDKGQGLVCKLRKVLYDLKQAPRAWFVKLSYALADF